MWLLHYDKLFCTRTTREIFVVEINVSFFKAERFKFLSSKLFVSYEQTVVLTP